MFLKKHYLTQFKGGDDRDIRRISILHHIIYTLYIVQLYHVIIMIITVSLSVFTSAMIASLLLNIILKQRASLSTF